MFKKGDKVYRCPIEGFKPNILDRGIIHSTFGDKFYMVRFRDFSGKLGKRRKKTHEKYLKRDI